MRIVGLALGVNGGLLAEMLSLTWIGDANPPVIEIP